MVSKIAVMALVAVVAAPILLGYGLNIQETTENIYTETDQVNVTDLLRNTYVQDSWVSANPYSANSQEMIRTVGGEPYIPEYRTFTTSANSLSFEQRLDQSGQPPLLELGDFYYFQITLEGYSSSAGHLNLLIYDENNNIVRNVPRLASLYYDDNQKTLYYEARNSNGVITVHDSYTADYIKAGYSTSGGTYTETFNQRWHWKGNTPSGPDINKGFYLSNENQTNKIMLPQGDMKSIMFTMDLNTITDSSISINFKITNHDEDFSLSKETVDGQVTWTTQNSFGEDVQLFYDNERTSNTYQIIMDPYGAEFRYVGNWPNSIGEVPYYHQYKFDYPTASINDDTMPGVTFSSKTPVLRVDYALIGAYSSMAITGKYTPSNYKSNPSTTISDITLYGSAVKFGGNTYPVDKSGNIQIGTKDISLNKATFRSLSNGNGTYDNTINGISVSTTSTPSSIEFDGLWKMIVKTASITQETVSVTKWEPGKFAWNGIDTNFKMAGLLASLGAFIGLAIYGRRSGAKVVPLLVVCGGAALMFLVMI